MQGKNQPSVVEVGGMAVPVSKDTIKATPQLLMDSLSAQLHQKVNPDDPQSGTFLDAITQTHVKMALLPTKDGAVARMDILDRFCGKATQQIQNVNLNLTMEDFLAQLADEEEQSSDYAQDVDIFDVEVGDIFDV